MWDDKQVIKTKSDVSSHAETWIKGNNNDSKIQASEINFFSEVADVYQAIHNWEDRPSRKKPNISVNGRNDNYREK